MGFFFSFLALNLQYQSRRTPCLPLHLFPESHFLASRNLIGRWTFCKMKVKQLASPANTYFKYVKISTCKASSTSGLANLQKAGIAKKGPFCECTIQFVIPPMRCLLGAIIVNFCSYFSSAILNMLYPSNDSDLNGVILIRNALLAEDSL